ncbi:GNAT family N-acetyltransferase [Natrinema pallidum]|uniref:GCN5-related N-acetyltransferase n=2 Tax=Natrinema pallidum TaxID=69527 RepID=L9YF01_9EURY|nr:GNAT family N-acetyltransferase [Natrinema pallidum]ELY72680.1 GCN5-related N-acetyltransferase [Natrinema pallidum DSM 3751]QCW04497.1 GNAT family N-acetyltransferase [Natrinema pallidum]
MDDLEVRAAETDRERDDAFAVRRAVFVEEQGVDEELEYDDHDETAVHFVAYDGAEPIGAARLREYEAGVGKVERVAVRKSHRDDGVGRALMNALEQRAIDAGITALKLHSQTRAADFYRSLGYERHGEEFEEAGIPHVEMRKAID